MKHVLHSLLAFFLAIFCLIGAMPLSAFANEEVGSDPEGETPLIIRDLDGNETVVGGSGTSRVQSMSIPEDAFVFQTDGHAYKVYSNAESWISAKSYCESLGGHLATITSAEENAAVYSYVASLGIQNAYFGLTDANNEGKWSWVTGEPVVYTNWAPGEPNSENSGEDYAMFYWKFSDGKWNDGDFGGSTVGGGRYYICEWDVATIPQPSLLSPGFQYEFGTYTPDSTWSLSLFDNDNCVYSRDLAMAALCLSDEIYRGKDAIADRLSALGFKDIAYTKNLFSEELLSKLFQPPVAFGTAKYRSMDGSTKTVISITIQGTTTFDSVMTDLIDGCSGFTTVGQVLRKRLDDYARSHNIDLKSGNNIFFITGHSLGGASAGRLVIELKKLGCEGKAFAYTFASPKYETLGYSKSDFPYLFNIVNIRDCVPKIPPITLNGSMIVCSRVGVDLPFDPINHINTLSSLMKKNKNDIFLDYFSKNKIEEVTKDQPYYLAINATKDLYLNRILFNHKLYVYLTFILNRKDAVSRADLIRWEKQIDNCPLQVTSVRCPVDVKIHDQSGSLLSYSEADQIEICEEAPVFFLIDGEDKYIIAPTNYPLDLEIVGTGTGTMEYSVQEVSDNGEAEVEESAFENIAIELGKTMSSKVGGEDNAPSTTKIYVVEGESKVAEIESDGTETPVTAYVYFNANEGEFAPEVQAKTEGKDLQLIKAEPYRKGYTFVEWNTESDGKGVVYKPGDLYTLDQDMILYAQWESNVPLPSLYGTSLTLENDLAVNFVVEKAVLDASGYTSPQVTVTFMGQEQVIDVYTRKGDYYYFTFRGVEARFMGETITAALSAEAGGVRYTGGDMQISVLSYCLEAFDLYPDDALLGTLLVDLLQYGAASQSFFDYDTEHLVTDSLTQEQLAMGTAKEPTLRSVANPAYALSDEQTITWYGASLRLEDSVKLVFYFSRVSDDFDGVLLTNKRGEVLADVAKEALEPSGGYYRVIYDGFDASELRDTVYAYAYREVNEDLHLPGLMEGELPVSIFKETEAVSNTLAYSVESYAYTVQGMDDEALAYLARAIMKYGASAEAFASR